MADTAFQAALKRAQTPQTEDSIYKRQQESEYSAARQTPQPFEYQAAKDPTTGKSVYDLQRERVSQQAATQQKAIQDAMARRLASQGLGGGVENKQMRNIAVDMAKAEAQGLTDVSMAELTAAEQARQAREQMDYNTRERLGTQAFQADMTGRSENLQRENLYANLTAQEQQLSEQARQFDTQQEYSKWALEQGFNQDQINRTWQAAESEKQRTWESSEAGKQRTEAARQFDTEAEFKKWATEGGWSQDDINRAWQSQEAAKQREFEGTQEGKRLTEEARQFDNKIAFDRWAAINQIDEATANRLWQGNEAALDRAMQREFSVRDYNVQTQQLAQQARQFDSELTFKKWATESGYKQEDIQRAWEAQQNAAKIASEEKMQGKALTVQEKQLDQQASQFTSEIAFKKWAQMQNIDEAQATRAWQSAQADQDRLQQVQLTKLQQQGQLTLQQMEMAQNSYQFDSEMAFKRWATTSGYAQNDIQRAWEASQTAKELASREKLAGMSIADTAAAREFQAVENEKERLFNKYVADQNLSVQQQELAQNSYQFENELDFKKWATESGYAAEDANRAWQANQNALNRTAEKQQFQAQLSQQADQFSTEMEFKRWATESGYEEEDAARAWQSAENTKARASTEKIQLADLTLREKELKQQGTQFTTEQAFKRWATEGGWTAEEANRTWQAQENEKDRAFETEQTAILQKYQTGERLSTQDYEAAQKMIDRKMTIELNKMDLSVREKELAQNGLQFKDKLAFDKYALQQGYTEAEKQRAWEATQQSERIGAEQNMQIYQIAKQGQLQKDLAGMELANNKTLKQMELDMEKQLLDYQTVAENKRLADKLMADSYYNQGLASASMTEAERTAKQAEIDALKTSNPMAYYAYQSGVAGKDKAEVDNDIAFRQKVLDALITSSAEKPTSTFVSELEAISKAMGITSVDFTKFTGAQTPDEGGTPFGAGDLARQLVSGETNWTDLNFTGKEDPVYKTLVSSTTLSTPSLSASLNRSGSNAIEVTALKNAKDSGVPIKMKGPDGNLDVWVVTGADTQTGDLGANRNVYTVKRLYDGKEQQITAYDSNSGAGSDYAWRWGGV